MHNLRSICWNITTKCNDKCQFCYKVDNCNELTYNANLLIAHKILESGVNKITLCGGEPLLYKDIFNLIKNIKEKKEDIILSMTTNGLLLTNKKLVKLNQYLDWITLDIDSINPEVETKMTRRKDHIENVIKILNFIENNNLNVKIKINTIVSKINLNEIEYIGKFIQQYNCIKRWKLMKFYPVRGKALRNRYMFDICDDEFEDAVSIFKNNDIENCKISISDEISMRKSYFSIYPDGHVRIEKDGGEIYIGNILKDNILTIYEKITFEEKLHIERYNHVFASFERKLKNVGEKYE